MTGLVLLLSALPLSPPSAPPVEALPELLRSARTAAAPHERNSAFHGIGRTLAALKGTERHARIAEAFPVVIAGLADPEAMVRSGAVSVLGRLGAEAAPAVLPLAVLLQDPDRKVRYAVLSALATLGTTARPAGPALLKVERGLDDEAMAKALQGAIDATGAGKDEATLAAEDEIRAAVVVHELAKRPGGVTWAARPVPVMVFSETRPAGLVAALERRGVNIAPAPEAFRFGAVTWSGRDRASVAVSIMVGLQGKRGICHLVWLDGTWVVASEDLGWVN